MKTLACNKCGSVDVFIKAKNENQTGLYCNDCGSWIKWISKNEKNLIENQLEPKDILSLGSSETDTLNSTIKGLVVENKALKAKLNSIQDILIK